jgi:CubicO group peptidase (beta-lactamase class C family)
MAREHVIGMALAVIDDGKIVHLAAYGHRRVAPPLPLTVDCVMYGASLTKTAFAFMLMQLVDEGKLKLDAPLTELLPKPLPAYTEGRFNFSDLAGDPRWRRLTPRILLTHSAGFANFRWIEPDQKLRFHFDPGSRYAYSGEGFQILQLIVEQGLGLDAGQQMQTRVFDRFGMGRTGMGWRPEFASDLADGYALDGAMQAHEQRSRVSAAGSMDTTIGDQAKLWAAIVRGDGLSVASRAELVKPQLPIETAQQFPTLSSVTDPANREIALSAGLGLVTFRDRSGPAWYKGGHDDTTANMVICFEARKRCLVMLGNDVRAERLYPDVARFILGDTAMPWRWEYGEPRLLQNN